MKNLLLGVIAATLSAGAMAQYDGPESQKQKEKAQPLKLETCQHCGTVTHVRQEKRKGEGGAVGIVGGAVVGGLLGNQIGGGSGRALATVGGAVAGGYVGNEVQKNANSKTVWITEIRMKDGSVRTFEKDAQPPWRAGNIVRVRGSHVSL